MGDQMESKEHPSPILGKVERPFEPKERPSHGEPLTGQNFKRLPKWLEVTGRVIPPVVLAGWLAVQAGEAARTDLSLAAELDRPHPVEVPTPGETAKEMAKFKETIKEIQEPGVVVSEATPTPDTIQKEDSGPLIGKEISRGISVESREEIAQIERQTIVYPEDTLYKIGQRLGVPWEKVAEMNNLEPSYTVYTGQILKIPERSKEFEQYYENRQLIFIEVREGFSNKEKGWLIEKSEPINKIFTAVVGPPFTIGTLPVERGKPGESHFDMWCYGPMEGYPAGLIKVRSDYPIFSEISKSADIYAHEISHRWLNGWENEVVKAFGGTGVFDAPHAFVGSMGTIAASQVEEIPRSKLEGDLFIQAWWRDPDFYLKLRKRYEEAGSPANLSPEQWQSWAEEVSPGFNEWADMVRKGPEVKLPEQTGKRFVWSDEAIKMAEEKSSQVPYHPQWLAGPAYWFMPWFGTGKGISQRLGTNRYLVYRVVQTPFYPETGPEGSLPYFRDNPFEGKQLGHWE